MTATNTHTFARRCRRFSLGALLAAAAALPAAEPAGFLREGDLWVFHGDSITHADTYRRLCARLFRHYHPEATVEFIQAGVWGSASSDLARQLRGQNRRATVASLMLGMNNAINGGWVPGLPPEPFLESYRRDITAFAHQNKTNHVAVILMSPTLTDETARHTVFRLEGTTEFLRACGQIVREVAQSEGVFYLPVQEEFEAFQATLERHQRLRPDGVHPASLGEYQIARTLCDRLYFAGALGEGPRAMRDPPPRLPVGLRLRARQLEPDAAGLDLTLEPAGNQTLPPELQASWSLGSRRGTVTVDARSGRWVLPWPDGSWPLKPSEANELVIDLRAGDRTAWYVVDLCAVPVMRFTDNVLTGCVARVGQATEGSSPNVAGWTLRRNGGDLLLEVAVTNPTIDSTAEWAWARDGLNLFWDLRPTERFGDINLDSDVHQTLVNVYDQPSFSAMIRPWVGLGMEHAAVVGGTRTPTGYKVWFRLAGSFGLHRPLALAKRDYIGLAVIVVDAESGGKTTFHEARPPQWPHDQFANNLPLIDLKSALKSEWVVNAHLFPPPHFPGVDAAARR